MELKNLNTCLNCENLIRDFVCKKHNKEVDITNVCDSHIYKASITKASSCSNCFHFRKDSCSNPIKASSGMLCFDWRK